MLLTGEIFSISKSLDVASGLMEHLPLEISGILQRLQPWEQRDTDLIIADESDNDHHLLRNDPDTYPRPSDEDYCVVVLGIVLLTRLVSN